MLPIKSFAYSIVGRRSNNQDSCLVFKPASNSTFFALADGMGGTAGGKIASRAAIESAKLVLKTYFEKEVLPLQLKEILIKIFMESQKAITEKIKLKSDLNGMGTTLTCLLTFDDKFVWGNLGDSRIYHLRDGVLKQITTDHTQIQEYLDKHGTNISQSILDNYSHFLTRSIDGGNDEPDIFPDVIPYEILKNGDGFLLCSDGLITDKSNKNTEAFEKYLLGTLDIESAAKNLIAMAYENGSNDNITVALCEVGTFKRKKMKLKKYVLPGELAEKKLTNKSSKKLFIIVVIIIFLLSLSALKFLFKLI